MSDRNTAIDLTQDIFMRYWDNLSRGVKIDNDRAFLFTVARNIIIDWYRKKKSISLDALQEDVENPEEFVVVEDGAKIDLELSAEARFLLDKIKVLNPKIQQILYLRYVEDLKPGEIGKILGIKDNAVSVRIFRALAELRKVTGYDIED